MATMTVPTSGRLLQRPAVRPLAPVKPGAKLTAIHRFALATVVPGTSQTAQPPMLLPETMPKQCCFNNFRCQNLLRWKIDDGFFCQKHSELWWLKGHFVQDHVVARVYADGEIGEDSD